MNPLRFVIQVSRKRFNSKNYAARMIDADPLLQPSPIPAQHYIQEEPVIKVKDRRVACDGGGILGHPKIFINLDNKDRVFSCMYCSTKYQQESSKH